MATSPERERISREVGALSKRLDALRKCDTSTMTHGERDAFASALASYFTDKARIQADLRRLRAKEDGHG